MPLSWTATIGIVKCRCHVKCSNVAVMGSGIGNWNCQMPLSITVAIEFKIFKLLAVLLEHLTGTVALHIILVTILVFKLI